MSTLLKKLIQQGSALVYFDDILLISFSKPHMLQLSKKRHDFAREKHLELVPEKPFVMLLTVKSFGQKFGFNTNKPIQSKIAAIHLIFFELQKVNWWSSLARWIFTLNFTITFMSIWSLSFFYSMILSDITWIKIWKHRFIKLKHLLQKMLLWSFL